MATRFVLTAALLPLVILLSCNSGNTDFTVNGTLQNVQGSQVKIYEVPVGAPQPVLKDSVRLSASGSFTWKTKRPKEETIYYISADQQGTIAAVFSDAAKITLEADFANQQDPVTIKGSKASELGAAYMKNIFSQLGKLYEWDRKNDSLLGDARTADSVKVKLLAERKLQTSGMKSYVTAFIDSVKSPLLKIYAISNYQDLVSNPQFTGFALENLENQEVLDIMTAAGKQFPDHKGLAAYKKKVAENMNRKAPDFTLPDVNGQPLALSSFKGKYVLIDFWASWCGPCRMENPNVVSTYQQYKNKNFTVLGVSLDRPGQKEAWLKAIKEDKLDWTHVSDLKYWESAVVPLYGINAIPYNVLIDPDGKILATNLRGPALPAKLQALLK